jgi:hypothetical protein
MPSLIPKEIYYTICNLMIEPPVEVVEILDHHVNKMENAMWDSQKFN